MKKTFVLVFAALFVLSLSALVSADVTLIAGTTYDASQGIEYPITDAAVSVECNGSVKNVTSSSDDGTYIVKFSDKVCGNGTTVTVQAWKGDLYGIQTGNVDSPTVDELDCGLNFEDVDVPMIPEFGLLIGSLTVIAAVTIFFVIRRN